ncbi:uncharacterized protein LOC110442132 [Mizuhopecten yessoensis]|uniref:Transporter mch1 n=1 Tax=Mizuhopecten yessoensis TaxID=6573 RepID=A0A210PHW6_MIZYE|nr:uncharacterized protein LOC110442132 [Mizuhopecten yessoensis]OWF36089.1 transporter mch1 [Mizuhopecten yessoensis]
MTMADQRSARYFTVMKWIGLAIGCAAKFVSGSLFVFNSYEDALKTTFNFTAKEVQLQSSFLNIGLGIGFLPGMFYDRFGPQWCSGAGLVLSLAAYLLLWSTTRSIAFYSSRSWLMAIYFFLCGIGSVFTYMVALNTNVINFHPKHRGKIVGILNAFFAGSPSVFATFYFHVIGKDDPKSADSFSTLMAVFAVCFVVIDILCVAFMRVYPRIETTDKTIPDVSVHDVRNDGVQIDNKCFIGDDDKSAISDDIVVSNDIQISENAIETKASATESVVSNVDQSSDEVSILTILTTLDYQLLTWLFTLASVVGLVYTIALTQTTSALKLDSHNADIVLVIPITNAVISAAVGVISDRYQQRLPRLGILIAGVTTFIICQGLAVGLADNYPTLVTATVVNGIGQGFIWSIAPAVMSEMFSINNLGRNWGIALLASSLVGLGAQEAFGALYDAAISNPGEVYCYGMKCVRWGHTVTLGMAVLAMILGVALYIRRRR